MKAVNIPVSILLVTLTAAAHFAISQTMNRPYQDHRINGMVRDAITKEPIPATLILESVPDASDVYIIEADAADGLFEIAIRENSKYIIEVKSSNYKPEVDTLVISGNLSGLDYELLSVKPGQLLRLQNVYFDQGEYQILESSREEIRELVLLLNQYPDMVIRLEGHTDRLGGRTANMQLSENRVLEIKRHLVNAGIHPKRIQTAAFGGSRPISTENTEESRQLNRRVEVRIISI